jgi:hypothetical protein
MIQKLLASVMKIRDWLPKELDTKYFDFEQRDINNDQFCSDILRQIVLSYKNNVYYRNVLCKKFNFVPPEELTIDKLEDIPYFPTELYKLSENKTLDLLKVPLEEIVLFSCSSSTTADPSIIPRTLGDFDQIQYNSIKVFSEFFHWKELKTEKRSCLVFNFAPSRFMMTMMAKKNIKGFQYPERTRYFTACMNKPWEFYGHEEYMVKAKFFKTIWAIISTFSVKGGFVLDVTKMLKMIKKVLKTRSWKETEVSKILLGGSPLLMNNMFENRLLKENIHIDLGDIGSVGTGGGGWDGVKGEAKMNAVQKTKFIDNYEKVFNIKSDKIADIYAFTEGPTLFGGHWSEKYQDFLLHCPNTSRIIVRDLDNLKPVSEGVEGLLEVITPYGVSGSINQAILVDDIIELVSKSKCPECGYEGATFRVNGRLKNAQGKSCSSLIDWLY